MSVLAVLLGLGVFLVYDACTSEPRPRRRRDRSHLGRASQLLLEAGYPGIAPGRLVVASIGAGLGAAFVVLVLFGSLADRGAGGRGRGAACRWRSSGPGAGAAAARCASAGPRPSSSSPARSGPATRFPRRSAWSPRRVRRRCVPRSAPWSPTTGSRATWPVRSTAPRSRSPIRRPTGCWSRSRWRTGSAAASSGGVLRTLAAFLREDLAVRKEVEARQSWTVVAARVAAAAPWVVLVLVASRPQGRAAFDSVEGMIVLVAGAVATVVGYRMMLALGRLPEEPRVLGGAA